VERGQARGSDRNDLRREMGLMDKRQMKLWMTGKERATCQEETEQDRREKVREPGLVRGIALRGTRMGRCPRKRMDSSRGWVGIWASDAAPVRAGEWVRVAAWAPGEVWAAAGA